MRRIRVVATLLALLVVGAGCSAGGGVQPLALGSVPWQDGERVVYDVLDRNGNKLGTSEFGFAKDGEVWVLSAADKLTGLDQSSKVRIDGQTLKPLAEDKIIRTQGTDATVNATYANGKLDIKAVVNGQTKSAAVDVPANILDNDQLLMTLRAAPLAEGYAARLVTVVPSSALRVNTVVRVQGKETVTVPAGSFEVWRVLLDFGQSKQTAWYQVAAPHHMVQYDNGGTKYVLNRG